MASRWFVFFIAMFVISSVKESGNWWFWLILAALTSDPLQDVERKLTQRALDLLRAGKKPDGESKPAATSK